MKITKHHIWKVEVGHEPPQFFSNMPDACDYCGLVYNTAKQQPRPIVKDSVTLQKVAVEVGQLSLGQVIQQLNEGAIDSVQVPVKFGDSC